jgi:hypothetical protein
LESRPYSTIVTDVAKEMARWDSEGKTGPPGTFTGQLHQKHGILWQEVEDRYGVWSAGRNDPWRQRSDLELYVSQNPEQTLATTEAYARFARKGKMMQPENTEAQVSLMQNLVQSRPHLASFPRKPREVASTRVHHCRVYSQTVSGPMPHALFLTMSTPMSSSRCKRRDVMLRGTRDRCTFHLGHLESRNVHNQIEDRCMCAAVYTRQSQCRPVGYGDSDLVSQRDKLQN